MAIIIFKGTQGDRKFEPETGSPLRLRPVAPVARTRTLYRAPCAEREGIDAGSKRAVMMLSFMMLLCICDVDAVSISRRTFGKDHSDVSAPSPHRSSWSVVAGSTRTLMMLMHDDTLRMRRRCKRGFSQNFRKRSVRYLRPRRIVQAGVSLLGRPAHSRCACVIIFCICDVLKSTEMRNATLPMASTKVFSNLLSPSQFLGTSHAGRPIAPRMEPGTSGRCAGRRLSGRT